MTFFHRYHPQPPLSDFINFLWLMKDNHSPHHMERVLPDGSVSLIINLEEDLFKVYNQEDHKQFKSYRGSLLYGPHSRFVVIDTACQASTMGVHFKPGGALPFLNLPADVLRNEHISLDTLWGPEALELREQLLESEKPAARFAVLEQFLMKQMNRSATHHPAVIFALQKLQANHGSTKIADVIEQIGLSQRRFIQLFKEEVGLTPKQFDRLHRFQHVLRLIEAGEPVEWTDLALACGYYDQAHFIHDFRSFSGFSPAAFRLHQGKERNHVPLG